MKVEKKSRKHQHVKQGGHEFVQNRNSMIRGKNNVGLNSALYKNILANRKNVGNLANGNMDNNNDTTSLVKM